MKSRRRGFIILIILVIILICLNPKTIKHIRAKTSSEEEISILKEIDTLHSSQVIYEKLNNGLIRYQEGILIYYNTTGEQMWSMNLGITRPVLKTNSSSVYIMDESKNQLIRISEKGEIVYKSTIDKPYKNFNVCNGDYVALHHDSNTPVQYITILNQEGNKVSEITLGEGQVTNLAISKNQDKLSISTIGLSGDSLENNLLIYNLRGDLVSLEAFKDHIILDIFYNEKGDLIVIDEKNLSSIDKNNEITWKTNFNEPIKLVDTRGKDYVTIYSEGSSKNSIIYSKAEDKIKIVGYDGKLIGDIVPKEEIIGLDHYKNHMLAYSLRTLFKYDKNGDIKLEYPYSSDILKSFILSEKHMVVITKEKATFLSLNKKQN